MYTRQQRKPNTNQETQAVISLEMTVNQHWKCRQREVNAFETGIQVELRSHANGWIGTGKDLK